MSTLFIVVLSVISALIVALLISIIWPRRRLWPPRKNNSGIFTLVWVLAIFVFGTILALGIMDWNGLGWPVDFRLIVGGVLIISGNVLAWGGVRQLGLSATSGGQGEFVMGGFYRYSRNPQYCGDILILTGWAVMSASAFVLTAALLTIVALVLTPFAEEPWLKDRFGDEYTAYMRRTPRFLRL